MQAVGRARRRQLASRDASRRQRRHQPSQSAAAAAAYWCTHWSPEAAGGAPVAFGARAGQCAYAGRLLALSELHSDRSPRAACRRLNRGVLEQALGFQLGLCHISCGATPCCVCAACYPPAALPPANASSEERSATRVAQGMLLQRQYARGAAESQRPVSNRFIQGRHSNACKRPVVWWLEGQGVVCGVLRRRLPPVGRRQLQIVHLLPQLSDQPVLRAGGAPGGLVCMAARQQCASIPSAGSLPAAPGCGLQASTAPPACKAANTQHPLPSPPLLLPTFSSNCRCSCATRSEGVMGAAVTLAAGEPSVPDAASRPAVGLPPAAPRPGRLLG